MLSESLMKAIKTLKAVVIYNNIDTPQTSQTTLKTMGPQPLNNVTDLLFPEDNSDLSLPSKSLAKRAANEELKAPRAKKLSKRSLVLKLKTTSKNPATEMDDAAPKPEKAVNMHQKSEHTPAAKDVNAQDIDEKAVVMQTEAEPEPAAKDVKALNSVIEYLHKIVNELKQDVAALKHQSGYHAYLSITSARREEDEDKKTISFAQFQRLDRQVQRNDRRVYALETGQQMAEPAARVLCASTGHEKKKWGGV